MIHLTDIKELSDLINSNEKVVLFWTANWCPDCNVIKPDLPLIEEAFSDVKFIQADRDEFIDLAREMMILGIPSFIAFKDGVEVSRYVDKSRKTRAEVEDFITKAFS
ncbi:MAG: thioredoxin family protein [Lactobacillales bacterium]|jgi:thiol-disulfide isomerase/thioredoxin|nr:thioredoxin family protein [Lactobacillales bacterium]